MNKSNRRLVFLFIPLVLLACSASKRFTKQGTKFEAAGLFEEAANSYYQSLRLDNDNVDARIRLRIVGQKVLEKKLASFETFAHESKLEDALNKYREAQQYIEKLENVQVRMRMPEKSRELYDLTLNTLAENHYEKAKNLLGTSDWLSAIQEFEATLRYVPNYQNSLELIQTAKTNLAHLHYLKGKKYYEKSNWESAIGEFARVQELVPGYQDAEHLAEIARDNKNTEIAEHYYAQGVQSMKNHEFIKAYGQFDDCLKYKQPYKNVQELQNEALDKGRIRIGIFPFKNSTRLYGKEQTFYAYVSSQLIGGSSRWIIYLDRANLNNLLSEQQLGISGIVDQSTAARAGKMIGLQYVVVGNLVDFRYSTSGLSKKPVKAWEKYNVKVNGRSTTRGKRTVYYACDNSCSVICKVQYQIINTETGQIVKSEIFSDGKSDYVEYAEYDGDPTKLTKSDPNPQFSDKEIENETNPDIAAGKLSVNFLSALGNALDRGIDQDQFAARKQLKSPEEMVGSLIEPLADEVADDILYYFRQLIPNE